MAITFLLIVIILLLLVVVVVVVVVVEEDDYNLQLSSYPRSFCASLHLKSPMKRPAPLTKPPM